MLKSALEPGQLVAPARAAVLSLDPEQPLADVPTMEQWVGRSLEGRRTPMMRFGLFGVVALLLSAIGLYGVLAFSVAQRRLSGTDALLKGKGEKAPFPFALFT